MARTALASQTADSDGVNPSLTAANADGHWIDPGDILWVVNDDAAPITVTIVSGGTYGGLAVADVAVAVPAGQQRLIGGLRADVFGQPSGAQAGKVYIDFSAVANVTVAAITQ